MNGRAVVSSPTLDLLINDHDHEEGQVFFFFSFRNSTHSLLTSEEEKFVFNVCHGHRTKNHAMSDTK